MLHPDKIIKENKLIAVYMDYRYCEEDVHYTGDYKIACMDTIYSKVPIEIVIYDDCKYFADLPNPDYGKLEATHWNNAIKTLSWNTLNSRNYIMNLQYHSSWDWLMAVIEKIEANNKIAVQIERNSCRISKYESDFQVIPFDIVRSQRFKTKIETVYTSVVSYIKWYNDSIQSLSGEGKKENNENENVA